MYTTSPTAYFTPSHSHSLQVSPDADPCHSATPSASPPERTESLGGGLGLREREVEQRLLGDPTIGRDGEGEREHCRMASSKSTSSCLRELVFKVDVVDIQYIEYSK